MLVNLTTAEMTDHTVIENALRRFIKKWRRSFGETEYVKVVEYNKRHTQPHFHLIIYSPKCYFSQPPKNFPSKLAWPASLWRWICETWQEALLYYFPTAKPTTVAWCQPPQGTGEKAARYAVGYITGNNSGMRSKNEEPDETWRGRKLTYSKNFFPFQPQILWQAWIELRYGSSQDRANQWVLNPAEYHSLNRQQQLSAEAFIDFLRRGGKMATTRPPAKRLIPYLSVENGKITYKEHFAIAS